MNYTRGVSAIKEYQSINIIHAPAINFSLAWSWSTASSAIIDEGTLGFSSPSLSILTPSSPKNKWIVSVAVVKLKIYLTLDADNDSYAKIFI